MPGHRVANLFCTPGRCPAILMTATRWVISGQKRGVFGRIKRELTRRSAIEAVIGHMKAEGHLGRCYLKGRAGDAANVILSAVGYNLRLVLAWLRIILRVILLALYSRPSQFGPALKPAS